MEWPPLKKIQIIYHTVVVSEGRYNIFLCVYIYMYVCIFLMLLVNFASSPYATKVQIVCSVERASLYDLVNETNLVHNLFSVYFVNFIYNLYIFQTTAGPSSGGTTIFMRHLALVILSGMQDHNFALF